MTQQMIIRRELKKGCKNLVFNNMEPNDIWGYIIKDETEKTFSV
jgi:hypothetical protein